MSFLSDHRPSGDEVRRVALAALSAALVDGDQQQKPKRFRGVRTLAAGAALYTAGVAAFKNRDAILERLGQDEDDEEYDDEPAPDEDEYEEDDPDAEFDDEDGPADEQDFEDEGDSVEEVDEAYEDDDEPEEDREDSAGSHPPVHSDHGSPDEQDPDIPDPPSRPRAPVGRR